MTIFMWGSVFLRPDKQSALALFFDVGILRNSSISSR
jgi:hypothetical protein